MSSADRKIWLENSTKLETTNSTSLIANHRWTRRATPSWAALTLLKIMFGMDTFLATKAAIKSQNAFPTSDMSKWKPNEDGPIKARVFRASQHYKELSKAVLKAIKESEKPQPQPSGSQPQLRTLKTPRRRSRSALTKGNRWLRQAAVRARTSPGNHEEFKEEAAKTKLLE
ncbi:hypothetical protein FSOLCH5_007542 [Fusarium solani]|nr:hypothetical protein NW759_008872 [Fusarium solani]